MSDFYAYWNANQIRDLFEAIVFIVGGGDFLGLLKSVAVAGALIVATGAIMSQRHEGHFMYLGALAFFYMVLLVPKQDVVIRDVRAGTVYVVNNVPLGVGFFAATASHIGYWLTDLFETAFIPANDTGRFSRFGLSFPQRAVTAAQDIGATTPEGRQRINGFVKDCVIPEMIDSPGKANEIVASSDIWATITAPSWLNPARVMVLPDGTVMSCDQVPASLSATLTAEYDAMKKKLGAQLVGDRPNPSTVIANALPLSEALLMNMSRTFEQSMLQSLMMHAVLEGAELASYSSAAAQPLAMAVNMSTGQANVSSVINYRTMASLAKNFLPQIRNAIEFLIIAAFPMMMLMVLAAGHRAGLVLKGFFVMLIWVQLWAPLYAVINYLLAVSDASPLSQIAATYGGNSLASVSLIRELGATSQDIAGMLTISVPIIAYALAKSSEIATTSMISSVFAPAQGAAQSMGLQMSQGNVNLGNLSWGNVNTNNTTANQSNRSIGWSDPGMVSMASGYGKTLYQDGRVAGVEASGFNIGASAAIGRAVELLNSQASDDRASSGWTHEGRLDIQRAAQSADQITASAARRIATAIRNELLVGTDYRMGDTASAGRSAGDGVQTGSLLSNRESAAFGTHASASAGRGGDGSDRGGGRGGGWPVSVNAGASFGIENIQGLVDDATNTTSASASTEQKRAAEIVGRAAEVVAASDEDSGVREAAKRFLAEFNRRVADASSQVVSTGQTSEARDGQQESTSGRADGRVDVGPRLAQMLSTHYGGVAAALRARVSDPAGFERTAMGLVRKAMEEVAPGATQGLQKPRRQEDVLMNGERMMVQHEGRAGGVVGAAHAENTSRVKANQPFAPDSSPNPGPVAQKVNETKQRAQVGLRQIEGWNDVEGGANRAAVALYKEQQKGMSTLFSNALLGGFRYQSPAEIAGALQSIAQKDPTARTMLAEINKGGIVAEAPQDRERLSYLAGRLQEQRMADPRQDASTPGEPHPMP